MPQHSASTRQCRQHSAPRFSQETDSVAAEGSPSGHQVAVGHRSLTLKPARVALFVCIMAKEVASLSNSAEKWLAALNLNLSPDLLGGINPFECK